MLTAEYYILLKNEIPYRSSAQTIRTAEPDGDGAAPRQAPRIPWCDRRGQTRSLRPFLSRLRLG
jgi:hypothetical protein